MPPPALHTESPTAHRKTRKLRCVSRDEVLAVAGLGALVNAECGYDEGYHYAIIDCDLQQRASSKTKHRDTGGAPGVGIPPASEIGADTGHKGAGQCGQVKPARRAMPAELQSHRRPHAKDSLKPPLPAAAAASSSPSPPSAPPKPRRASLSSLLSRTFSSAPSHLIDRYKPSTTEKDTPASPRIDLGSPYLSLSAHAQTDSPQDAINSTMYGVSMPNLGKPADNHHHDRHRGASPSRRQAHTDFAPPPMFPAHGRRPAPLFPARPAFDGPKSPGSPQLAPPLHALYPPATPTPASTPTPRARTNVLSAAAAYPRDAAAARHAQLNKGAFFNNRARVDFSRIPTWFRARDIYYRASNLAMRDPEAAGAAPPGTLAASRAYLAAREEEEDEEKDDDGESGPRVLSAVACCAPHREYKVLVLAVPRRPAHDTQSGSAAPGDGSGSRRPSLARGLLSLGRSKSRVDLLHSDTAATTEDAPQPRRIRFAEQVEYSWFEYVAAADVAETTSSMIHNHEMPEDGAVDAAAALGETAPRRRSDVTSLVALAAAPRPAAHAVLASHANATSLARFLGPAVEDSEHATDSSLEQPYAIQPHDTQPHGSVQGHDDAQAVHAVTRLVNKRLARARRAWVLTAPAAGTEAGDDAGESVDRGGDGGGGAAGASLAGPRFVRAVVKKKTHNFYVARVFRCDASAQGPVGGQESGGKTGEVRGIMKVRRVPVAREHQSAEADGDDGFAAAIFRSCVASTPDLGLPTSDRSVAPSFVFPRKERSSARAAPSPPLSPLHSVPARPASVPPAPASALVVGTEGYAEGCYCDACNAAYLRNHAEPYAAVVRVAPCRKHNVALAAAAFAMRAAQQKAKAKDKTRSKEKAKAKAKAREKTGKGVVVAVAAPARVSPSPLLLRSASPKAHATSTSSLSSDSDTDCDASDSDGDDEEAPIVPQGRYLENNAPRLLEFMYFNRLYFGLEAPPEPTFV